MNDMTFVTITEDDIEFFKQRMLRESNPKARKKYEKQYQILLQSMNNYQNEKTVYNLEK